MSVNETKAKTVPLTQTTAVEREYLLVTEGEYIFAPLWCEPHCFSAINEGGFADIYFQDAGGTAKKAGNKKAPRKALDRIVLGGADGTRTRDPRRDRPVF